MRKYFIFLCLVPFLCSGQYPGLDSLKAKHKLHKHPFPLSIVGISVLTSDDDDGQNLLGKGYFNPLEPHGGARYYWDISKNIQIKYVIGVDKRIDQIVVTKPEYPFEFLKDKNNIEVAKVMGRSLDYSVVGKITLGDDPLKIIAQYGRPNDDNVNNGFRIIQYVDDYNVWNEVLHYEAIFTFKNDKLIRIDLYNGE